MTEPLPQFCPIPLAAAGDDRLTASHWRLLCAIAWHDRLGSNGTGCYASHVKLAARAKMHPVNVSKCVSDLVTWEYVKQTRNPLNRRLRVYQLIYNGNQGTPSETANDSEHANNKDGKLSETANDGKSYAGELLAQPTPHVIDPHGENRPKYIGLSPVIDSAKQREDADGRKDEGSEVRSKIAQQLRQLEAWLKQNAEIPLANGTREELQRWAGYCNRRQDSLKTDDALHQWARRLGDEISYRLEG